MCLVDNNNRTRVLRCAVTALAYVRNMKLLYIMRLFQEKTEPTHKRCLKTAPPFWNNPNATIALPLKQRLSTQSCMAVNPSRFSVLPGKQLLSQRGMQVSTWLDYWPSRTGLMTPPALKHDSAMSDPRTVARQQNNVFSEFAMKTAGIFPHVHRWIVAGHGHVQCNRMSTLL